MNLFGYVRSDLARYSSAVQCEIPRRPRWVAAAETCLFKSGFHAVLLYRISHSFYRLGMTWAAWSIARFSQAITGAEIEFSAQIGAGLLIAHPAAIVIGRGTVIGGNATIYQGVTCGIRSWKGTGRSYPRIGDEVVLCAHASVLGGICVGNKATIGAHTLVIADVPAGAVTRQPAAVFECAEAV
ncbi:MAG TPA: hypothetical protein VNT81_18560 [Vicinamibacterales bacterium]|nr:hypothetical protein [Vicinamibacterales bacterium]